MKFKFIPKTSTVAAIFSMFILSIIIPISSFALNLNDPLAGDFRCGATPCPITAFFPEVKDLFLVGIIVIAGFAIFALVVTGTKGLVSENQPEELKRIKKQAGVVILNLLIAIVLIGSIFMAFVKSLFKPEYQEFFGKFLSMINDTSLFDINHAYAQAGGSLNPMVFNSVWDILITLYQLGMRWVGIPILIGSWVWAGFLLIQAQGNPEKIKYARERLWYSFVWTLFLMLVLGVAFAFRNSFNQIFT